MFMCFKQEYVFSTLNEKPLILVKKMYISKVISQAMKVMSTYEYKVVDWYRHLIDYKEIYSGKK